MKKTIFSASAFAVAAVSAVAVAPTTSEAVPAFARQTGAACLNCHFQAVPRLAAMGRNFRMGGFRDMGEQALIEDDHLSLPAVFNMSFLMKARISSGTETTPAGAAVAQAGLIGGAATGAKTQIQFPDETALLFGGRVGEHAGMFVEMGYGGSSGMQMLGYKFSYVLDMDAGLVSVDLGTSDALGVSSVFNDPSNALSRNLRGIQTRSQSLRGTIHHAGATGVGVHAYLNDLIYVAAGGIVAAGGGIAGIAGVDLTLSPYTRVALTTELAGFDAVVGAWTSSVGTVNYQQAGTANTKDTQTGFDLQLQGEVGDLAVGFYLPVVTDGVGVGAAKTTGYNPYLIVNAGAAQFTLGYDKATTGATKYTNTFVAVGYELAQNIGLNVEIDNIKKANGNKLNATTIALEYVY